MRSRHTSGRTPFNPMGNSHFGFVASGNLLCSRVVLLIYTCELLGLRYLVEQPGSSFLGNMPRRQQLLKNLEVMRGFRVNAESVGTASFYTAQPWQVFYGRFWMGQFNGETAKPHVIWSNDRNLIQAIMDRGGSITRSKMAGFKKKLATSYTDKSGVRRHSGKKKELKESQKLGFITMALPRFSVTASWLLINAHVSRAYTKEFGDFLAALHVRMMTAYWLQ